MLCNVAATCKSPSDAKNYTHYAREIDVFYVDIVNDINAFGVMLFALVSFTLKLLLTTLLLLLFLLLLVVVTVLAIVVLVVTAAIIFCVDCNVLSLSDSHKSVLRDHVTGKS